MLEFGALSSAFDFIMFGVLLRVFGATPELFRTSWFVELLLTELAVALVMRTRRPFFRSRPGTLLLGLTMTLIPLALAVPYLPFMSVFGFVRLPAGVLVAVVMITIAYVAATELQKKWFYARTGR